VGYATMNDATTKMLQQTAFINKIRMLHQMWRNTISRCSMRMRMKCRASLLWLEHLLSFLLSFVTFSYQFSSVICLIVQCIKFKIINFKLFLCIFDFLLYFSCLNGCVGWQLCSRTVGLWQINPQYIYFNVCWNKRMR
jgi:hypothetical protein